MPLPTSLSLPTSLPSQRHLVLGALVVGSLLAASEGLGLPGQRLSTIDTAGLDAAKARAQIEAARKEGAVVRKRAEKLEARARSATREADKAARETAALAARIQENEAAIAAREARISLIASQRMKLRADLAERQGPLARLTGSLQRLSRRPPLLALLRPGSVRDTVYLRALLDTVLPEVDKRTADLRAEIEKGRRLEREALAAETDLRQAQATMRERRQRLAALETRQRLASRAVGGTATRENERALALAEKARDLGELVAAMDAQGKLREKLAALPGPIMRPPRPEDAQVVATQFVAPPEGLGSWTLPVMGRLVTGFAEEAPGQARANGITLAPRGNAQAIAPAPGRVAFAGLYRGHGRIVILEHEGGWTSLVTGLARLDVRVGETLVAGAPLGIAAPRDPRVMVELRREGTPVNPLDYVRSL
ncbi:peptidoglycan DD-metalloendopeptidase family protein [Novosphingobium sp. YJ-S2-02]|uniref:Peptidoglycan DD-metalloendopeptidase family protein n=1 Tax=Novosphingobium aureum TaxID=2792964 RepID=A0A931H9I9_9SPHN|nr:peptidoglycan DD-metalloendopeptidase family protein [Novosphingobium aureum]